MLVMAAVAIAETVYVGMLGTTQLAAIALVFPMIMLMQMLSAGAMGGGVSSAISRALGAGDDARAAALALHALTIGAVAGARLLGAVRRLRGAASSRCSADSGAVLEQALVYAGVALAGAIVIWLVNTLASIVRGTGNMRVPSVTLLARLGAADRARRQPRARHRADPALSAWPASPRGLVVGYAAGAAALLWFLRSGRARITLRFAGVPLKREMFSDILQRRRGGRVLAAADGADGADPDAAGRELRHRGAGRLRHRRAARVPAGADRLRGRRGVRADGRHGDRRRRRGARAARRLDRCLRVGVCAGADRAGGRGCAAGCGPACFTSDPGVLAAANLYLRLAGPAFVFVGLGLVLYFASQGAGKVLGPVLAATVRLLVIAVGGWCSRSSGAPAWTLFALVARVDGGLRRRNSGGGALHAVAGARLSRAHWSNRRTTS